MTPWSNLTKRKNLRAWYFLKFLKMRIANKKKQC